MKKEQTKKYLKVGILCIALLALGLGSCGGPHHGGGNHKNHMKTGMGNF
jgi:hypothetical protein